MQALLNRSNTATTISSFWCSPPPPPAPSPDCRPTPPLHYEHIDSSDPLTAFQKIAYPRSRSADLRASKLGLVEKMSSKERMERWNEIREEETTPLERWRLDVAKEVGKEIRREKEREMQREREIQQERVTSWKPSVVTTSSMRSATNELRNQLESSSPFARSFAVESLKTPLTADSQPSSSIVRASFLNDPRKNIDEHPYSQASEPERPNLTITTSNKETSLLPPPPPETSASVSPIDPAFSNSGPYRFPLLSDQRHPLPLPLPRLDTDTPVSLTFTNSPVAAPVVTEYQSIPRPPRSSSLPFCDLESLPPTPPPKPTRAQTSYELLPPKAAALLGLIPSSHTPFPPPKPSFARDRDRSNSLASTNSTEQYRSSFYTDYDGPLTRPSCDSTTPTSLISPSSHHRKNESSSTSPKVVRVPARSRPPPLTLRKEGMTSLPDLTSSLSSTSSTSLQGRTSLDTPRHAALPYTHKLPSHSRSHTLAETEVESLLDAPLHNRPPLPSPPFPLPTTRFGQSIGHDLGRGRTKGDLKEGGGLVRSLSGRGKGLVRKMSGSLGRQNSSVMRGGGEKSMPKRKSLRDLKKGFEKVERGLKYW